ncbi:MAG: hypothetical protein Ct9H300mP25_15810 [Acidobacteriota bacterium]|nr:MAG: hypothetical protein Ct9H300mP25_15810 [Acidobacteriota bacterium]
MGDVCDLVTGWWASLQDRVDGTVEPTQLTTTPAIYQNPAWSPAGDRIVAIQGPSRALQEAAGPFASGPVKISYPYHLVAVPGR